MLITNPDLINSCRVCRSPNQDGDYECLYQNSGQHEDGLQLSEAGLLYENLLDISLTKGDAYPQFLCNSCDLQMKLFKKLKDKAYKTLEYLQNLYEEQLNSNKLKTEQKDEEMPQDNGQEPVESAEEYSSLANEYVKITSEYQENAREDYALITANEYEKTSIEEFPDNVVNEYQETSSLEYPANQSSDYQESVNSEYPNNENEFHYLGENSQQQTEIDQETPLNIQTLAEQLKLDIEQPTITDIKYRFSAEEITENPNSSQETIPQIRLDLEPIIDKTDYVTEIYELLDDESKQETLNESNGNTVEYDIYTEEKPEETSSVYSDVEYVIEEEMCDDEGESLENVIELKGTNRGERKLNNTNRRKNAERVEPKYHDNKYPCSICARELKSLPSLHQHMKIHNEQPAYQCNICQKTFNQKAHYLYHMNRHNNIRNFKCTECDKTFIAKTDLKVHMRTHTGDRPYVCNICGKDYLMMEHLKTHLLTHTEQYFQCDICNHKFATHKTLRMHVRTIHEDEPRFKCSFCSKPFRRKHHLEYHLKLHQKNVKFLDSHYEMVDVDDPDAVINTDTDYNADELVDQELVDDPGFIALKR
ncbi:zinc finger protein 583-like [Lucilia sericata]|uniref:zinc finger protein 583-like n=1 Tax=Lucilia sericata TaxID=13632 RepID=UPI0018A873DB|nr:zinc finger protein 583-like [Lucilia sericata]